MRAGSILLLVHGRSRRSRVKRGDMDAIKGLRISSSTAFPNMVLKHMLAEAGINLERDKVEIVSSPATGKNELWRGRDGVDAIERGADAFWGNGMRAAIGEKLGVAKIHLDLRRGDGPSGARLYNFAALTTTDRFIKEQPQVAAAAVRAIVKTQRALRRILLSPQKSGPDFSRRKRRR